jgi:hypothetical protein
MNDIFNNNGFWTITGIIIGGIINHIFSAIQSKRQEKIEIRISRQEKIVEICDFFSVLMEKVKFIYGLIVTGGALEYLSEHTNLWEDVPLYKIRMIIQMFFPKCIDTFDELQIAINNLVLQIQKEMDGQLFDRNELDKCISVITEKINILQNNIIGIYSKTLCMREK